MMSCSQSRLPAVSPVSDRPALCSRAGRVSCHPLCSCQFPISPAAARRKRTNNVVRIRKNRPVPDRGGRRVMLVALPSPPDLDSPLQRPLRCRVTHRLAASIGERVHGQRAGRLPSARGRAGAMLRGHGNSWVVGLALLNIRLGAMIPAGNAFNANSLPAPPPIVRTVSTQEVFEVDHAGHAGLAGAGRVGKLAATGR